MESDPSSPNRERQSNKETEPPVYCVFIVISQEGSRNRTVAPSLCWLSIPVLLDVTSLEHNHWCHAKVKSCDSSREQEVSFSVALTSLTFRFLRTFPGGVLTEHVWVWDKYTPGESSRPRPDSWRQSVLVQFKELRVPWKDEQTKLCVCLSSGDVRWVDKNNVESTVTDRDRVRRSALQVDAWWDRSGWVRAGC